MARTHGSKDFWLAALRADGPAFRTAAGEVALDAPVPSCPGWTMLDLVHHLGGLYGRIIGVVTRGDTTPPPKKTDSPADQPPPGQALDWWDERFTALMTVLDGLDPDQPAWNWAVQPKKAVFWHRRMAHETTVHRWDAQMAAGLAEPVETKLAADGVSEVLDSWLPGGRRRGPADRHGVVHLVATDAGQDWYVRLRGAGVALLDTRTLLDSDAHGTRTVVAGTASDLDLALWGRVPFDALEVTGDATLPAALLVG